MKRFITLLAALLIALGLVLAISADEDEKAPVKTDLPFGNMAPADAALAAIMIKDMARYIEDAKLLQSRISDINMRDGMEEGMLQMFSPSYTFREFMPTGSFEEFQNAGLAEGSWATFAFITPEVKKTEGDEEFRGPSGPIDICFYSPKDLEGFKKILDKGFGKILEESSRYSPMPPGFGEEKKEEKKEEEKPRIEKINYKGVEILKAAVKESYSRCGLAMVIGDTAVYSLPYGYDAVEKTLALMKKIIDTHKGEIPSLAADAKFKADFARINSNDNFVAWGRLDRALKIIEKEMTPRRPVMPGQPPQPAPKTTPFPPIASFAGGGFHGSNNSLLGSFSFVFSNEELGKAFGPTAWDMAKHVPDEGLSVFFAADFDLGLCAKKALEIVDTLPGRAREKLDEALMDAEQITRKDIKKELIPLLGHKFFFAFYGASAEGVLFLAGIDSPNATEMIKIARESVVRQARDESVVTTDTYKDREIISFGTSVHILQDGNMIYVSMSKAIIKRLINCMRGKGVTFAEEHEEFGAKVKSGSVALYFDGQEFRRQFAGIEALAGGMIFGGSGITQIFDVFRKVGALAKTDGTGLSGNAWVKLGPEIKISKETISAFKVRGSEASMIASLRTISSTQEQYRARYGTYGTLAQLSSAYFIDEILGSGKKSGYVIQVKAGTNTWSCIATPQMPGVTGTRGFFVNESGVMRYTTDGTPPTTTSPALD